MLDTLSNVKARLGITGTAYDTFITQQISLISDVIEAYCRRKFAQANYKQTFFREDMCASYKIDLYHFPVSTVASIVEDGVTLDSSFYRLHKNTGIITGQLYKSFFTFPLKTEVSFTAGYATIPTPILSVLDVLVQERYNKKASGVELNFGSDVQRISIPGAIAIDFDYSLTNNQRTSSYGVILGSNVNILDDWSSERSVIGSGKLEYVEVI